MTFHHININDKEFELFNDIQRIDNLEYQKKVKKHEDNIINHITSLGDRDTTISVKVLKKIGLEID